MPRDNNTGKEDAATVSHEILAKTRQMIQSAAGEDFDRWSYINRFVFARLSLDERKQKTQIKKELFASNPVCHRCKERFQSQKNIHLHRLDRERGYHLDNSVLMHPDCHREAEADACGREEMPPAEDAKASGESLDRHPHQTPQIPDQADELQSFRADGFLADDVLRREVTRFPLELVFALRERLETECEGVQENLNTRSPYLGYGSIDGTDFCYVWLQRSGMRIDLRIPAGKGKELEEAGFIIKPVKSWQARAGWLTGLRVPYDSKEFDVVIALVLEAFENSSRPITE